MIQTNIENFNLRFANKNDISIIYQFIKELAEYEKLADSVLATEEILYDSLFKRKIAEVIFGEFKNQIIAFALFFHNFSTFIGKPGLYLEDIFIKPEYRNQGFGKTILSYLCKLAIERDCGRVEWMCLDWNKKSIDFYLSCDAKPMNDWKLFRLSNESLVSMSTKFS